MPNFYKISGISRILMLIACCALSNAQMLYVGDFCNFAGYDGTCLEASKCPDLQPIMHSMGYESYHVGRCGFAIREEIICCPKWPTPVQTPPQLPNEYIDLSQRPEFGYSPPPDSVFNANSIAITTSTPMINNNQERVQNEDEKLRVIFNGNFGQAENGINVAEFPLGNANNSGVFIANPVSNVQDNQKLNGNPIFDENQRINEIFNVNLEQPGNGFNVGKSASLGNGNNNGIFSANPMPNVKKTQNLNGTPIFDENQRINEIFNVNLAQPGNGLNVGQSAPLGNGNNNGIFSANPMPNVKKTQNLNGTPIFDENQRINEIFNVNLEQPGNGLNVGQSAPLGNGNNNGIFSANPMPNVKKTQNLNGNPIFDENQRINEIFNVNLEQPGNGLNVGQSAPLGNGNNNGIFSANPMPNVKKNQNLNGTPIFDENQRINEIFNVNLEQPGNGLNVEKSAPLGNGNNNGIFSANPVSNVQKPQNLNGNPIFDENQRINEIFNVNFEQPGNGFNVGKSAPFGNGNNNGIFNANPVPNVKKTQNLNGNPIFDENQRINDIFNGNPVNDEIERFNGSGNTGQPRRGSITRTVNGKSVPVVNENNNGIFSANPVPNVKKNQNLNGQSVNDELLKAIFDANSAQFGNGNGKVERKQKPFPVVNANNKRNFNANSTPIPIKVENIDNNAARLNKNIQDENALLNAIFNADLNRLGRTTTGAKENTGINDQTQRHSIRNDQVGIEPIPNKRTPHVSLDSRNSFNNEHFKQIKQERSEETVRRRKQRVQQGFNSNKAKPKSTQNTRKRF